MSNTLHSHKKTITQTTLNVHKRILTIQNTLQQITSDNTNSELLSQITAQFYLSQQLIDNALKQLKSINSQSDIDLVI